MGGSSGSFLLAYFKIVEVLCGFVHTIDLLTTGSFGREASWGRCPISSSSWSDTRSVQCWATAGFGSGKIIYIYIIRASRHYIYITFQSFRVRVCWWKLIVLGHPAVCTIHDWTPEQGKYQAILATLCWLGRVGTPSMPAEPWNLWLCHAPIHSFCCDQNVCCFHFPGYIMSLS